MIAVIQQPIELADLFLAVELLQKLLKGEIKARAKRNVVQAVDFHAQLIRNLVGK